MVILAPTQNPKSLKGAQVSILEYLAGRRGGRGGGEGDQLPIQNSDAIPTSYHGKYKYLKLATRHFK